MDNCKPELVEAAIENYELGPDAYDRFIDRINREIDVEERVSEMSEMQCD